MSDFTTKQIADQLGVHPNTVRLYEKWGYISPVKRRPNGYRAYTEQHLEQLKIARIAFPGPYPVSSRPLYDMVQSYKSQEYSRALELAKVYRQAVHQELEKTNAALKILDQWHKNKYGSDKIIANSRKEFAALCQLSVETVRTWERNGIFQPQVSSSRCNKYSELNYEKVQIIRLLRKRGFSIASLAQVFSSKNNQIIPSQFLEEIYKNRETSYVADEWLHHLKQHIQRADQLIAIISKKITN